MPSNQVSPHSAVAVLSHAELQGIIAAAVAAGIEQAANANRSEMLTLAECGISVRTLRDAIKSGALPARRIGKGYCVKRSDLQTWLDSKTVQPSLPAPVDAADAAIARAMGGLKVSK